MKSGIRLTEAGTWAALCIMAAVFLGFQAWAWIAGFERTASMQYYASIALAPLKMILIALVAPYLAVCTFRVARFVFGVARDRANMMQRISQAVFWKNHREMLDELLFIGRTMLPAVCTLLLLTGALDVLNSINASRLIDLKALEWDRLITGTHPFIAWSGSAAIPSIAIKMVILGFNWLAVMMLVLAFHLLRARRGILREFTAAFSFSCVIMLPLWYLFPVMSPHDRFLDNVYELPVPEQLAAEIQNFRPVPEIADFLSKVRDAKTTNLADGPYPTSTLPSAHVAWGTFLAYYAWRSSRRLGIFLGIVAILSTIGTFLLAQHYFIDAPAGIVVAVCVIAAVKWAAKKDAEAPFSTKVQTT